MELTAPIAEGRAAHALRLPSGAWLRTALLLVGIGTAIFGVVHPLEARTGAVKYIPLDVSLGLSLVLAGTLAWARRPENRTGLLMVLTGFAYFAGQYFQWADTTLLGHFGDIGLNLTLALLAHQFVVFPRGRARSRLERFLIGAAYFQAVFGYVLPMLFYDPDLQGCYGCGNLLLVDGNPGVQRDVAAVMSSISVALALAILGYLLWRWLRASRPARRALTPVLCVGPVIAGVVILTLEHNGLGVKAPFSFGGSRLIEWSVFAYIGLPLAFLVGLLRTRLHRTALGSLVVELSRTPTPEQVEAALALALGDPSLRVAYSAPELGHYVDAAGRSVELPVDVDDRAVTVLEHEGAPLAALVYDPSLLEDAGFVDAAAAAARLALQNARLQAELRAQLAEVRASRARILAAGDEERRRLERDLHDGAQQRLLATRLALQLVRRRAGGDPELEALLEEADGEVQGALDDIRSLAQGLHPALLGDEGLAAALAALARRSPVPVEIVGTPAERLPSEVETAAYFVAAEGLANAAKHAAASRVRIDVTRRNGLAVISVDDDGAGGAAARPGGGLSGLRDRVEALGGRFALESRPGEGTELRAELPCA